MQVIPLHTCSRRLSHAESPSVQSAMSDNESCSSLGHSWLHSDLFWIVLGPLGPLLDHSWTALGLLGSPWGSFWVAVGVSWTLFGRSCAFWDTLAPLLAALGCSWALLARSWAFFELLLSALGPFLGCSWGALGRSGGALGRSWGALGSPKVVQNVIFLQITISTETFENK